MLNMNYNRAAEVVFVKHIQAYQIDLKIRNFLVKEFKAEENNQDVFKLDLPILVRRFSFTWTGVPL